MSKAIDVDGYIARLVADGVVQSELSPVLSGLTKATRVLAKIVSSGAGKGDLATKLKGNNGSGDAPTKLDVLSNEIVMSRLSEAPVAWVASEECERSVQIVAGAPLSVAIDPLDGSSNIETNAPVGTIFSIVRTSPCGDSDATFLQPGSGQVAAGFVVYGPQCSLVLSVGRGTAAFTLDPDLGSFVLTSESMFVSEIAREFAINASNARHWSPAIRNYVEDCVAGVDGPRGRDFNMRWIASLVAEAERILVRSGVYLYPHDSRTGYEHGRLRLIYEANPIAFLIEQAGGAATDGVQRVLDLKPQHIHQKVPLVFGSRGEVELIARYVRELEGRSQPHQLFSDRGLLRH
ncbi:class 1 fructose-bisphosphatase [uncultured Hyphomicrobium sp.]|uniref:class 1 fructose-bisphosphatase n=1 Tax=uncultured Hyphomicrobium sp. TaxID=194373 RepID=UPI0025FD554D|nr:class 1 fructose-bisphosphatase [uncultured Hyphomicrobium sp.]